MKQMILLGLKKPSTKFWECSHISGVGRGNYGSYKNRRIVRVIGKNV